MAIIHLKRTSLYDVHRAAGARIVEFGGWEMPVQYAGIVEAHHAVRTGAGLFDVSHMGEVEIFGPGAVESVQRLVTNDAGRLTPGEGLYSPMCLPSGGIIDDLTVFRLHGDRFLLVVNATRTERDFLWIAEHTRAATARNRSAELALLALQGPKAETILGRLTGADLTQLAYFHLAEGMAVAGLACLVARTGYTGENGFEIACEWNAAPVLWRALMDPGGPDGLVPGGLGAGDALRLEAGYMLYGNDIDETTTPLEAPLGWTIKFEKGEFIGREALLAQKERGAVRKLVGFEMMERAVPRHGYALLAGGPPTRQGTSGTFGPWIRNSIGIGYIAREHPAVRTPLQVGNPGRATGAQVAKRP